MGGLETGALHFVKYRWFKKSQMPYKFIKTYWCPVILWLVRIITTIKCTFRWWKIKTSGQSNLTNRPHRRRTWTVVPILYNGLLIAPQNCPFPWGIWTPSNTWFLGPTRVLNPNGISIGSAVLHSWPQNVPILYSRLGRPFSLKIAPSCGGTWTPSNTWFLGPTRVLNPNGISIGSAALQGSLRRQTDRSTDIPRTTLLGQ